MTTPAPPRLPIPGGRQLTVRFNNNGQDAVVVLGGVAGGSWNDADGAAAWRDAFWLSMRPLVHSSVSCLGATLRDVSGPDGQVIEVGAPASPAGGAAGTAGLLAGSTLIKWSTATGGRTGKGRTYLPGLGTGYVEANGRTYTASFSGTAATAIAAYLGHASMTDGGIRPAVLSFRRGAARRITSGGLAPVVGVQRRRMR